MTRIQKERFLNEEDYIRLKDCYILTKDKLINAKDDLCIMHPLPRVNEISIKVDDDSRACYFKQVLYGKYIRMALILKMLEIKIDSNIIKEDKAAQEYHVELPEEITNVIECKNLRCITSIEQELNHIFVLTDEEKKSYRCKYCETLNEE